MTYVLSDIARDSVALALETSGIGLEQIESLPSPDEFIVGMIKSTERALEWGAQALGARPTPEEIRGLAFEAVFEVLREHVGFDMRFSSDAIRLVASMTDRAAWADLQDLEDEQVRAVLASAARDLGLDTRPVVGREPVVDEAGRLLAFLAPL